MHRFVIAAKAVEDLCAQKSRLRVGRPETECDVVARSKLKLLELVHRLVQVTAASRLLSEDKV